VLAALIASAFEHGGLTTTTAAEGHDAGRTVVTASSHGAQVALVGSASRPSLEKGTLTADSLPAARTEAATPDASAAAPSSVIDAGSSNRQCIDDGECPQGLGCAWVADAGERLCTKSRCRSDDECGADAVCRVMNSGTTSAPISVCIPIGRRTRGDSCDSFTPLNDTACEKGLLCVFEKCGPRCDPGADAAHTGCRDDENCVRSDRDDSAACRPNCMKRGCGDGFTCLPLGELTECVKKHGEDCTKTPCPEQQACDVAIQDGEAFFRCYQRCESMTGKGCGVDEVCGRGSASSSYCYKSCDPKALTQSCRMGQLCTSISEDNRLFGCK
jgi:hypothetical protein